MRFYDTCTCLLCSSLIVLSASAIAPSIWAQEIRHLLPYCAVPPNLHRDSTSHQTKSLFRNFFFIFFASALHRNCSYSSPFSPPTIDGAVHNGQPTWADKPAWADEDAELMDSPEERLLFLEKQLSTLRNENESMLASRNDLLKEKIALKEHNSALADMISNLNGYITQLRASVPTDNLANTQPILTTSHREQKIPDPPLFAGNKSKARAWIMDLRLKLAAENQFFRTEQAKMNLYQQSPWRPR